jgi:Ni/Fe-hydrogenase subunit HybB-like protein
MNKPSLLLQSCRVKQLGVYCIGAILALGSQALSYYLHLKVSFWCAEWITYTTLATSFLCCVLPSAFWEKTSVERILWTVVAIISWPFWLILAVAINIFCGGKPPGFH